MPTGMVTSTRGDQDEPVAAPTVPPIPMPGEDPVKEVDGVITAIGPTVDLAELDKQTKEVEEGVEYRIAWRDRDGVIHHDDPPRQHSEAAAERARFALKGERVLEVWVEKRTIGKWEPTDVKGLEGERVTKASDAKKRPDIVKLTRDGDA